MACLCSLMANAMAILLSFSPYPPRRKPLNPKPHTTNHTTNPKPISVSASETVYLSSRRRFIFNPASLCLIPVLLQFPVPTSSAGTTPAKSILSGIANTKSWFQFFGDGFAIRVPPEFVDITEPEDYNAGLSLYGDKAKTKTFAARFASSDGYEVVSVVIKPSNQLKITFLEAKDITAFGSLKEAARLFVPGGSTVYSARTIKIKEDEGFRTYYFYEFGRGDQHVALVAAVNSGRAFIAGATAPQSKWDDDGVMLRSAAVSLTVL